jgi:anti-sigma factor (TIGR02949 family)
MSKVDRYTCEETFRRLNDYLDRELSAHETQLVEKHLEICAVCAREFAFEESVLKEVRAKVQRIAAPPDLLAKVSLALKQTQAETDKE